MMASDLWSRIWLLCQAYPNLAILCALAIWTLFGGLVTLAIFGLNRPRSPVAQRRDDDDQAAAISGRAPLESWQRAGGNWRGDL